MDIEESTTSTSSSNHAALMRSQSREGRNLFRNSMEGLRNIPGSPGVLKARKEVVQHKMHRALQRFDSADYYLEQQQQSDEDAEDAGRMHVETQDNGTGAVSEEMRRHLQTSLTSPTKLQRWDSADHFMRMKAHETEASGLEQGSYNGKSNADTGRKRFDSADFFLSKRREGQRSSHNNSAKKRATPSRPRSARPNLGSPLVHPTMNEVLRNRIGHGRLKRFDSADYFLEQELQQFNSQLDMSPPTRKLELSDVNSHDSGEGTKASQWSVLGSGVKVRQNESQPSPRKRRTPRRVRRRDSATIRTQQMNNKLFATLAQNQQVDKQLREHIMLQRRALSKVVPPSPSDQLPYRKRPNINSSPDHKYPFSQNNTPKQQSKQNPATKLNLMRQFNGATALGRAKTSNGGGEALPTKVHSSRKIGRPPPSPGIEFRKAALHSRLNAMGKRF